MRNTHENVSIITIPFCILFLFYYLVQPSSGSHFILDLRHSIRLPIDFINIYWWTQKLRVKINTLPSSSSVVFHLCRFPFGPPRAQPHRAQSSLVRRFSLPAVYAKTFQYPICGLCNWSAPTLPRLLHLTHPLANRMRYATFTRSFFHELKSLNPISVFVPIDGNHFFFFFFCSLKFSALQPEYIIYVQFGIILLRRFSYIFIFIFIFLAVAGTGG